MAIQQKPNFQIAWSETGNKVAVSEAKLRQGWVAEIPPAEVENFYQNRQDTAIQHIFQSGIPLWDNLTNYTANKSYVQGSNGAIYIAASDNTGQNPVSTTAWRLLIDNATQLVNQSRAINTGYGLQGGGSLTSDRTISMAASGVAQGQYGSASSVPSIFVDAAGRIVSAANQAIDFNTPIQNVLANRAVFTSGGLQGGGTLDSNKNISIAASGVGAGFYGNSQAVGRFYVGPDGRLTAAQEVGIDFGSAMQDRNYGGNGWQMFPAGFLMQWGTASCGIGDTFVTFPRPFPNACLSCMVTPSANYGGIMETALAVVGSPFNGVSIRNQYVGNGDGGGGFVTARFLAVGF